MQPRQRSPRGFYASEYRRDASFGRGHPSPKSFSQAPPPPPPPPRRGGSVTGTGGTGGGDVFVEAGRLATEYLVSQGMLPPNALSLKWNSNGYNVGVGFKKQGEIVVDGGGARTSALSRLGNDGGLHGRRKSGFDEFGQKGIRRRGGFRSNGFDWGREVRRNGSWNDRYRGNFDMKDDGYVDDEDSVTRMQDDEDQEQQQQQQQDGVGSGIDGGGGGGGDDVDDVSQKLESNEIMPRSEDRDDLDAERSKDDHVSGELSDLKQNSPTAENDTYNTEMEFGKSSDELENVGDGVKEVNEGALENVSDGVKEVNENEVACNDDDNNNDIEKSSISKNLSVQSLDQEDNSSDRVFTDLLSLCKSVKVPTRIRSSLTNKNLKAELHQNDGDGSVHDTGSVQGPEILAAENESGEGASSGDLLSNKTYDLEHTDSDVAIVEPIHDVEDVKELDTVCTTEEVQPIGSQSGEDGGYVHDNSQESSATLPEYGSCSTVAEERGEKRAAEPGDIREETKRLREWLPVLAPRTNEYFVNSSRTGMKENLGEDEISSIDKVTKSSNQSSLFSSPQFTQGGDKQFIHCSEEKQSLPSSSSFRTCDLNLIEASENHENHVDHPILIYPPATKANEAVPVDIDLTMGHHASVSSKFSTHSASGKQIEVIDLEDDSTHEEKPVENMERKEDTMFQGLEGFSNHAQNTADIHDVQDGYGLMISELLATDFPHCSSVPNDMNSVHNEMGLHNGTGPLTSEDDSIYMSLGEMSLGEIPLSFYRPWEQPPSQDYQKPF